jgi:hypothetical protein
MLGIATTAHHLNVATNTLRGAITPLRLVGRAIILLKLRIVNVDAKGVLYGIQICAVAIRC